MAVCSNSVRQTVTTMMEKANLSPYLSFMISNEDVRVGKPNPEMYLTAMQRFGVDPKQCLIVEDNENGIKAARASGAHVMIVRDVGDTNLDNIVRAIAGSDMANAEGVRA